MRDAPEATPTGPRCGPGSVPGATAAARRDHHRMALPAVHLHLHRRAHGRWVAGVAAGLGATFRIEPNIVRLAFVLLTLAGGIGLVLYGLGWLLLPVDDVAAEVPTSDVVQVGALGVVVLGVLLVLRELGWWLGDEFVWPLALATVGLALVWARPGAATPTPPASFDRLPPAAAEALTVLVGTRRGTIARVVGGALLVVAGVVAFATSVGSWDSLRSVLVGTVIVVAGLAVALGPAIVRLVSALGEERRERIREAERADVAAHLHDSVLQTLALVQRKADDPREVRRLARRQERELRTWLLHGEEFVPAAATLGAQLEAVAAQVEDAYGVQVEVVRVRDCPSDANLEPLVLAAREAMVNAARHSGADVVSVYVEVEPQRATVFVRDRGKGFDLDAVPSDRRGVAESIVGRLARHGGRATITSEIGDGTEVELAMARADVA
jgi:signal transduction histidine kinase/phage shock protein PspC (stress-responsive transcriptional regulator)